MGPRQKRWREGAIACDPHHSEWSRVWRRLGFQPPLNIHNPRRLKIHWLQLLLLAFCVLKQGCTNTCMSQIYSNCPVRYYFPTNYPSIQIQIRYLFHVPEYQCYNLSAILFDQLSLNVYIHPTIYPCICKAIQSSTYLAMYSHCIIYLSQMAQYICPNI
jgi:hypothetical protein